MDSLMSVVLPSPSLRTSQHVDGKKNVHFAFGKLIYSLTFLFWPRKAWIFNVPLAPLGRGEVVWVQVQAPLASPAISNPAKNSLGTNGGGLTRFDCISNKSVLEIICLWSVEPPVKHHAAGCTQISRQVFQILAYCNSVIETLNNRQSFTRLIH